MTLSRDQTVIDETLSDDDEIFEEAVEVQEDEYEELDAEVANLAREELGETESLVKENVKDVRSWVQTQPHLRHCRTDTNFLTRFLRTNKHNREKTCKMLERYLKMRTQHPKWFQNLDIEVSGGAPPADSKTVMTGSAGVRADRERLHFCAALS